MHAMPDAHDQHDADLEAEAIDRALAEAQQITERLNESWAAAGSRTRLLVLLGAGSDDQALFTFVLALDLPDDFDPADWPSEEVDLLDRQVREALASSVVDDWDWVITARAARR